MAAAEAAPAAPAPSFAPEDPTLLKPWKGLIDGNTGVLYYWNPETNVTQYEKPAGSAPPVPSGPPTLASPLNAVPVPTAQNIPSNGFLPQQQSSQRTPHQPLHVQQQLQNQTQSPLPIQQSVQQMTPQQLQQLPYQRLQSVQNQQPTHISLQPSQQYSQIQQFPYQQISYMQGKLMPHPQGQFPYQQAQQAQAFQFSYQHGQQLPAPKIPQHLVGKQTQEHQIGQQLQGSQPSQQLGKRLHGPHATQEQGQNTQSQQTAPQQGMKLHAQQILKQQEMLQQGHQPAQQQSEQIGFPGVGDADLQEGKLAGLPPSESQQAVKHQLSGSTPQAQIPQPGANMIQPHLHHQLGGSPPVNSQPIGMSQSQQVTLESFNHPIQDGIQMFPNQIGHSMVSKIEFDEDQHERGESQFYSSGRLERQMLHPVQPKLTPLPLVCKQQDMRLGAIPPKFHSPGHPGGSNMSPGHAVPNIHSNAAFPNATPVRPSPRMFGPPDSPNISADAYLRHHEVTAMGDNIPTPFMTFEATGFSPEILSEIHAAGFLSPTPIQAQTWPIALQNRDIVAIAKTGSGKTLGYLIPAFIHLRQRRNNPQFGPTVMILSPTRELATQIQEEAIKFGRSSRISCTCLYGGAPKGPQLKEIERGVDIVVATPGRLNDILEMGRINFRQVSFLVLDEADRMLDMGFELQIRKIIKEIPPRRQTLMYTATWPAEVRKIAGDLLVNPVQVNIGNVDELVANKSITQFVEVVSQMDKQRRLEQFLRSQERGSKIIIFCSTKKLCDQLARSIGRPYGAIAIHGDKSQTERDHVLNMFRSGTFPILVATDVAARGLDIKDIRVVINYDFPTGIEDYVHRIGRTGRAGATGVSYTFFTDQDWKHASELIKVLEGANQRVPQEVREIAARRGPTSQRIPSHGEMSRWDSSGGNGSPRMGSRGSQGTREFGRGGNSGNSRGFVGRSGRNDLHFDGRGGSNGRGFGRGGWGRHDRGGGPQDRFQSSDGRGRSDGRRGFEDRMRSCSYSRSSPEKVLNRGYGRSRSPSRRRMSRSPSWSSRSRSKSSSRSRSRSRSHSRSYERYDQPSGNENRRRRASGFDAPLAQVGLKESEAPPRPVPGFNALHSVAPAGDGLPESEPPHVSASLGSQMSSVSPGHGNGPFTGAELGS